MNDFGEARYTAASLIGRLDAELRQIVFLSLGVSLTASVCAFAIGGWFLEPAYSYSFSSGHEQSLGATVGFIP